MKWLSLWRQRKGITQTQLSDKSGIDSNMISRYERETATPTLETTRRLALGLGITVDELLNGPVSENWELKILMKKEGVIDMTNKASSAVLLIEDEAMAITLSGSYELWEDDAKFEDLIGQLRKKRAAGLKTRREDW